MLTLFDLTTEHGALARTASAVLTAVRQADALTQGRDQDRFVLFYLKLPAALPERDVKCHKVFEIEKSVIVIGSAASLCGTCRA
jgi:hypothetical protein